MNKKLVAVPLLVAIGLSICGFVYAHWTATVYINGNATTGCLMLGFTDMVEPPEIFEVWRDLSGKIHNGQYLNKSIASTSANYMGPIYCPQTGLTGYNELALTVDNAYPGYMTHITYNLLNLGTIPVDMKKYIITGEKRNATGTLVYNLLWDGKDPGWLWEDVNNDTKINDGDVKVISIRISNSLPVQIDPYVLGYLPIKREIDLDFTQDAEQCHTYNIHVTIVGIQWNKVNEP
jgi:hypothetical protein